MKLNSKHFAIGYHPEIKLEIKKRPENDHPNSMWLTRCDCGHEGRIAKNTIVTRWKKKITYCKYCKPVVLRKEPAISPDEKRAADTLRMINTYMPVGKLLASEPFYWGQQ